MIFSLWLVVGHKPPSLPHIHLHNTVNKLSWEEVVIICWHVDLLPSLPKGSASVVHLGMFVCLSVRMRNSKTIATIDLIFSTQEGVYAWLGPPLRRSGSGSGSGLKNYERILHHCKIGPNMTSKYAMMSNVRYDEKRVCIFLLLDVLYYTNPLDTNCYWPFPSSTIIFYHLIQGNTVLPRYNAVTGRHLLRPRYKRGAL